MDCNNCPERKRADYWHRIATFIMTIIGGMLGGLTGIWIIQLIGK